MRVSNRIIILLLFFVFGSDQLSGQSKSLLHEIRQDTALDMYLMLDWKHIEKNKKEKSYQPCQVTLTKPNKDAIVIPGRVKTRGNMRLQICSFPPLKLKFEKSELAKHGLSVMNEMDIVQHCHEAEYLDQCLLREYLAYKLWELISPNHFKTQLLRLHYINLDGSSAHDPSYAFLVENTEELVDRMSGRRYKSKIIGKSALDKNAFLQLCLFQFMIGNTDWFVLNRHNLDFVALPGYSLLVPVPYDFDYSGLVDAPYAAHHESLNMSSVQVRYYQGWCHPEEEVREALKVFQEQKENILSMPLRIQGLNERSIKQTTAYLEDFFEIIEHPQKFKNQILRHCDMWPVQN